MLSLKIIDIRRWFDPQKRKMITIISLCTHMHIILNHPQFQRRHIQSRLILTFLDLMGRQTLYQTINQSLITHKKRIKIKPHLLYPIHVQCLFFLLASIMQKHIKIFVYNDNTSAELHNIFLLYSPKNIHGMITNIDRRRLIIDRCMRMIFLIQKDTYK